jgi:hypothetical protein
VKSKVSVKVAWAQRALVSGKRESRAASASMERLPATAEASKQATRRR